MFLTQDTLYEIISEKASYIPNPLYAQSQWCVYMCVKC